MRHHSRLLAFRNPQGAVPCGTNVRIEAELSGDEGVQIFLRTYHASLGEALIPMRMEFGRATAEMTVPNEPGIVWYFFVLHTSEGQTFYYGAESGEGMFAMHEPQSYRITVYDGAFQTPAKWREGIAYQIFPDRFRRSSWEDFRNRARYHTSLGRFLRVHDRWSEKVCHSAAAGQADYAPDDFFGGDLNGIREKLPYLSELGVTALYLNPVFESASNHRYDTADYHRIDPILGTEAEFHALCEEAKALGMTIMLDGVFSHTGADSRYFDKYGRYDTVGAHESADSSYGKWYSFQAYPNEYDCWWNFPTLPNVKELEPSYMDFIAGENGVIRHWAEVGATSWRLDVADELPDAFIRMLRSRIKALDPNGVLMGEVWEECSNKLGPEGRRGYVNGDELDCAMNYPFTVAVTAFLLGRIDAHGLNHRLQSLREFYPRPFYEACLNLLSSHDIVRVLTALSGAPDRNAISREQQATYRPSDRDDRLGRQRVVLATTLQMSMPGVPCVYYGDEAGMTGMADPFNRAPYPWGAEDRTLLEAFRKLMHARRDVAALKHGLCRMGALSPDVFAVLRYLPEEGAPAAVAFINRSQTEQTVTLDLALVNEGPDAVTPVSLQRTWTDVLTGETHTAPQQISLTLPPVAARLLIG